MYLTCSFYSFNVAYYSLTWGMATPPPAAPGAHPPPPAQSDWGPWEDRSPVSAPSWLHSRAQTLGWGEGRLCGSPCCLPGQ